MSEDKKEINESTANIEQYPHKNTYKQFVGDIFNHIVAEYQILTKKNMLMATWDDKLVIRRGKILLIIGIPNDIDVNRI